MTRNKGGKGGKGQDQGRKRNVSTPEPKFLVAPLPAAKFHFKQNKRQLQFQSHHCTLFIQFSISTPYSSYLVNAPSRMLDTCMELSS
jgi:hypothetical protein